MKIQISDLKQLIYSSLLKKYSNEDAQSMTNVLLFGELSGKTSHGIVRLLLENQAFWLRHQEKNQQLYPRAISLR